MNKERLKKVIKHNIYTHKGFLIQGIKSLIFISLLFVIVYVQSANKIGSDNRTNQVKSYFGMNGGKAFHIPNELNTTVKKRIEWMKELGVKWDRSDWWWHIIEPEKGKFDFTIPDRILKFYEDNGIQIYPILCYQASWWKGHTSPLNEQDIDDYANYVYKTVEHYKGRITYWSIWNEPNIQTFWNPNPDAEMYAKLLKKAYIAAKKANPNCKICAPAIAPQGEWDMKYVERLYQLGCKDYFDVFDYHYYRNTPPEETVGQEIAEIRALMHRYGDDNKPIWISETGIVSPIIDKPKSYEEQASLIIRNHLLCYANGVEKIFYFDLQNWSDSTINSWDGQLGLVQANDEKKPSFYAYQTMVKELEGKQIFGTNPFGVGSYESILVYDKEKDEFTLVVWLREKRLKRKMNFYCDLKDIKIVDTYGNTTIIQLDALHESRPEREIEVDIDENPKYIHSVNKSTNFPNYSGRPSHYLLKMAPGETQSLEVHINPMLDFYNIKLVSIHTSAGVNFDYDNKIVKIDEGTSPGRKNLDFMLQVPFNYLWDKYTTSGYTNLSFFIYVDVTPQFSISNRPYLEDNLLKTEVILNNLSSKDISGKLQLVERREFDGTQTPPVITEKEIKQLKSKEALTTTLTLDRSSIYSYTQPMDHYIKFNMHWSKAFRYYPIRFLKNRPDVNGNLDEWKGFPTLILYGGSQITRGELGWTQKNAFANTFFWFTQDTIYFAAEVTDNDPMVNPYPPLELWRGDCFELYLGFGGPTKRTSLDKSCEFQIAIAPTCNENRPIVFQWHVDKEIKGAQVAAKKTERGYNIEAAIPIKELGNFEMKDGMLIGLDVALDDLDKGDWAPQDVPPGRALMWNGNNMNWINPSGWGMGVLKEQ